MLSQIMQSSHPHNVGVPSFQYKSCVHKSEQLLIILVYFTTTDGLSLLFGGSDSVYPRNYQSVQDHPISAASLPHTERLHQVFGNSLTR